MISMAEPRRAYIDESIMKTTKDQVRYLMTAVVTENNEEITRNALLQTFPNIINFKTSNHYRRKNGDPLQEMLEVIPQYVAQIVAISTTSHHSKMEYARSLVLSQLLHALDSEGVSVMVLDKRANNQERKKNNPDLRDSILLENHKLEGLINRSVSMEHRDDHEDCLLALPDMCGWVINHVISGDVTHRFWAPIESIVRVHAVEYD